MRPCPANQKRAGFQSPMMAGFCALLSRGRKPESGQNGLWRLRPNIALVKGDDFDPVRALAGRVASDRLQRAGLSVDRVRRDSVRLLAGHDNESAGRVDIETAGLLLGRRASEIGELSTRGIDAEGGERARRALRSVEKAAVRREVKIR